MIHFLIFLSVILIHEIGHYTFARIFGMKILNVSLFLGTDIIHVIYRGTKYALGWLPLGGYVRIKELFWVPTSKKDKRKKLLVLLGGCIVNFLLGAIALPYYREFALISIGTGVLNLVPLFGTDGYHALKLINYKIENHVNEG